MAARKASLQDGACARRGASEVYSKATNTLIYLRYELESKSDDALSRMHRWLGDCFSPSPTLVAAGGTYLQLRNAGALLAGYEGIAIMEGAVIGGVFAGPVGAAWGAGIGSALTPVVAGAGLSVSLAGEPDPIGGAE